MSIKSPIKYPAFFLTILFFAPSCFALLPPLRTEGNAFANNFHFHGINWFGFNNGQTMVDGLWIGGSSIATDFNTIVYRLKLLGFNAVRLPFTFADLARTPKNLQMPCTIAATTAITASTVSPNTPTPNTSPPQFYGTLPTKSPCNAYLTSTSTTNRLIQVIDTFIKNDFYVIIDYHPMGSENHALDADTFTRAWVNLANSLTPFKGRILFDLLNEPDSMHHTWETITPILLKAMDALYNSWGNSALFLVEGTGQTSFNMNWGDGFITDRRLIKAHGLSDPNAFFTSLLEKPYLSNVIISPHIYGPTISKTTRAHKGPELFDRLHASFGTLATKGYCAKNKCHKFPILIGEFGSFFDDPQDVETFTDLARFLKSSRIPVNWAYWAYNRNSMDTGGIVKENWYDLEWKKLDWLRTFMDLKPWYY